MEGAVLCDIYRLEIYPPERISGEVKTKGMSHLEGIYSDP